MAKISNEELLVAYLRSGFNLSETAKALGVCRQTVAKRFNSNEFQELLTVYRKICFSPQVNNYQRLQQNQVQPS